MTPTLQTRRLLLIPRQPEDTDQIQQLFPQWEIVKHLNAQVPWPFPADGALNHYLNHTLPAIERGEEWHWTLRLKTSPEQIIGAISLLRGENNRGFWLIPEMHRQGLMTEAVIAVNDYWFDVLKFPVLRAPKAIANTASRRLSEKTGMRVIETKDSDYVIGRLPTERWEITAEEWRSYRSKISGEKSAE
jgi:ribosomal-protein-alanine N-acetyltransferase